MIWLKRLLAWMTRREVVWLRDHDGEVVSRIAHRTPYGLFAWRVGLGVRVVQLHDGGRVSGAVYVESWLPDRRPKEGNSNG